MTRPSPRKVGKALPPIYVVVRDGVIVFVPESCGQRDDEERCREWIAWRPGNFAVEYAIVRYVPAPTRRAKGAKS